MTNSPLSRKLPPTERDFDIYEAVHIAGYPTREEAAKHGISPTRVRQIVRRVIEWLGEIIPPQATIAKEQQSHLARQIAADRFNLQYAEGSTNWHQSGDLKFAGLRIRITHAQARLGIPGSLIGGLAADAIEGIEVPAYVAPLETNDRVAVSGAADRGDEPRNEFSHIPDIEILPTYSPDPVAFSDITEEVIASREAAGDPLPFKVIKILYEQGYLPTRKPNPNSPLASPSANPQSEICNPQSASTPHSALRTPHLSPPPPGDCAAVGCVEPAIAGATHQPITQTPDTTLTCDDNAAGPGAAQPAETTTSQPLPAPANQPPVLQLKLAPNQPGARIDGHAGSSQSAPVVPTETTPADDRTQQFATSRGDHAHAADADFS